MQSILAVESAPHRGRAIALASAGLIALFAIVSTVGHAHHRPRHAHHRLHVTGHCSTTVYLVR